MPEKDLSYRRVLITGAGGFVGKYLIPRLRARLALGAIIFAVQRDDANPEADRRIDMDITDIDRVVAVFDELRPDLVVHLAGQSSISQQDAEIETWRVNVCGTINIAAAIVSQQHKPDILFTSSAEIYGKAFKQGEVTEDSPPLPQTAYGRSKLAAEQALNDIAGNCGNRVIIVRPSNHSGSGQDERFVIPSFAAQIARIEQQDIAPEIQVGNLDAERDFLDVRDVVDSYIALLASRPISTGREIYNIASGTPVSIQTIVDRLRVMSEKTIGLRRDPNRIRQSDVPHARLSIAHLQAATNWKPSYSLDDTLADVLAGARLMAAR